MPACHRLFAAALALALAACGGQGTSHPTTPAATAPAPRFELAEMTVFDGPHPMVKLHADGSTELGVRSTLEEGEPGKPPIVSPPSTAWKPGPKLNPDGTIAFGGKLIARLDPDGTIFNLVSNKPEPLKVSDDRVELTSAGHVTTIELAADGKMTILNPPGRLHDQPPHVEGADTPGKRRTVLALIGLLVGEDAAPSHVESPTVTPEATPPADSKPAATPTP